MTAESGSGTPMSERMQALLSRAVEDQLSEQRQLASAIAEFRAQVSRLAQEMEELRGAPAAATASMESSIAAVSGEVREAVRLLGERLDRVNGVVQQRGHDLAELRSVVADLHASVVNQSTAMNGVAGGLAALPAFGDRIAALQDTVAGLHDRLRGLEELVGSFGLLQQRVEAVDGAVRELRGAFTGIASRVADLPARGDIEGLIHTAVEPLTAALAQIGRVEEELPSLRSRLDDLATVGERRGDQLAGMSARLDEIAAGASRRAEQLTAVSARLGEIATAADEHAERVAGLDGRLGDVADGVRRHGEQVAGLHSRIDEVADGVGRHAEQLAGLHTRLEGNDVSPRLAAVESGVAAVESGVAAVESGVAAVRDRVDEIARRPSRDTRVDDLVASVNEIRAGLFGEDGLEAQVRVLMAPKDDNLDERVATAVRAAVADSERRLGEHIDEAVLALAEALLRRRMSRGPVGFTTEEIPVIRDDMPAGLLSGGPAEPVGYEEPQYEEPAREEPVAVAEEPVAEEPVAEEPVAEEPIAEEPIAEEPIAEEPVAEEEPAYEEAGTYEQPGAEPAYEEPAYEHATYEEPAHEPAAVEPEVDEGVVAEEDELDDEFDDELEGEDFPADEELAEHDELVHDGFGDELVAAEHEGRFETVAHSEPAAVASAPADGGSWNGYDDDAPRRRRPWWRPGD